MGTTEWIALGLLIIALIGWLRWGGSPLGSKAFQYGRQETSVASTRLSSFAADRTDNRSNKYEEELETLRVRPNQQPPPPRRRLRL